MTAFHLPAIRRIVTGDDAQGRSSIIEDAACACERTVPERPNYRSVNVWRTTQAPVRIDAPDTIEQHQGILPPAQGGTVLRIIDIPPEPKDPAERQRQISAMFKGMFADADHDTREGVHPGMHRTDTVDYAIILQGEIYAIMDKNETLMKAGDVLIQRGTNHAWANRSDQMARICFVLIDGQR